MILFRCILYTHNIRCVVAALLEGNGLAEMNTTSNITYSASSPLCFEGNGLAETWRGLIATCTTTYDTQGDATRQNFDVDARILHSASSPLCFERNGMATPDQHTPHPIRHTTYMALRHGEELLRRARPHMPHKAARYGKFLLLTCVHTRPCDPIGLRAPYAQDMLLV